MRLKLISFNLLNNFWEDYTVKTTDDTLTLTFDRKEAFPLYNYLIPNPVGMPWFNVRFYEDDVEKTIDSIELVSKIDKPSTTQVVFEFMINAWAE